MDLSPGSLFAAIGVSTVGFALFRYGKKELRVPQLVTGIVMMAFPYFVASPVWILTLGATLAGGLWLATRAGL